MDVTMMPFIAEAAQPMQAQKPAGRSDAPTGEEGGFAEVFAGLVADTPGGGGEKKTAADEGSEDMPETSPGMMAGMVPGMWSFVPLMPPVMNAGQAQTAEGTGAIAPLTAAGMQATTQLDAARGQSLPGAQAAPPVTADADLVSQMPQQSELGEQTTAQFPRFPMAAATVLTPATADTVPQQTTTPVVQADAAPVMPVAVAAQPTAPMATAEVPPSAVPAAMVDAPQVTGEAVPTVMATVVKPQTAPTDRQTEKAPPAGTMPDAQTAAAATPVPSAQAAGEQAPTGEGDTAQTAKDFAPTAPKQAAADTTTAATAFAAMAEVPTALKDADAADTAMAPRQPAGADPNNVAGQIVDHARLITRAENSEMVIKLKPEHLGELTLKIAVENGTVSATFHTASAEVRSAIEASLPQLRQDMASQGLKIDNVGVYASLDQFFANDQRHAPQQQQLNTVRRQSGDETFSEAAVAAAALPGNQTASGGIDYRV